MTTRVQDLPVVVDSPLGVKLTALYAEQQAYWGKEAHDLRAALSIILPPPLMTPRRISFLSAIRPKGTLGKKIVGRGGRSSGTVAIHGQNIRLRATVHTLTGYSAHADQQGLLDWVAAMPQRPGAIKLIHGEAEAQASLGDKLRERGYTMLETH